VPRSERRSGGFSGAVAVEHLAELSEEADGGNDADEDGWENTTIVLSSRGSKRFDLLEWREEK